MSAITKIALGRKNRCDSESHLCSRNDLCGFLTCVTLTQTGGSQVQRAGFRGCFLSRSDFFELRLQSLAICDFEVAAIRVNTHSPRNFYKLIPLPVFLCIFFL